MPAGPSREDALQVADLVSRRAILAVPALLAFTGAAACAKEEGAAVMPGSKALVAYLTRSGNTRVIAVTLQRALGADLFEIRPAQPYPEDYERHVAQAQRERDSGYAPPLAERVANLAAYDTVYLGFPIWGETTPPPIRTFLTAHPLAGKTVRPFITHGGYGVGNSLKVLAEHAAGARIAPPFVMEADQERRTLNAVNGWLEQIRG